MVGRIANTKEDGHALQKRASGVPGVKVLPLW